MNRTARFVCAAVAFLAAVSVLHAQLNLGGLPKVVARMRPGKVVERGELLVGFLPVT